jgi:hypothetical protein
VKQIKQGGGATVGKSRMHIEDASKKGENGLNTIE